MNKFLLSDEKPGHITTLLTGRSMDLADPRVEDIFIEDIAAALTKLNRFSGYTSRVYTVAEHCLLGLEYVPAADRMEFLMHDATEAYLGDVSGPLKSLLEDYRLLEAKWTQAIAERFGLKPKMSASVKLADQRMLVTEMRDLRGRRPLWRDKVRPYPMQISAAGPSGDLLERDFLEAFDSLVSKTEGAVR